MKTQESGNLRKGGTVLAEKLIDNDFVMFDLEADSAEEVIRKMADVMEQNDRLIDKETYVADVLQREKVSGTAVGFSVGFSVATPHAKSEGVKYETLAFAHLKKPIVWDGKEEVSIIFMIGVPSPAAGNRHLEILASLFRKVIYDDFREKLVEAKKPEEIVSLLETL